VQGSSFIPSNEELVRPVGNFQFELVSVAKQNAYEMLRAPVANRA